MGKIWLDVTTLLGWYRPAVGIVRVEAECAMYAIEYRDDVHFCRYDLENKCYFNVDRNEVLNSLVRIMGDVNIIRIPSKYCRTNSVEFECNDIYLSMGIDWDQKDLAYLYALKNMIGFKVILFCYDVIPVKLPHLCLERVADIFPKYFCDVAWCADRIICISECTLADLNELLTLLGTPVPPMSVIRLGCNITHNNKDSRLSSEVSKIIAKKYIMYVSTIEKRKNHVVLYEAYKELISRGERNLPSLILVGMHGWGVDDFIKEANHNHNMRRYINIVEHISDLDLRKLYENAYFTVYPSLYEGWGLPVAESLTFGKFCLASNTSSIPEVGGDLVDYIDPSNATAWAERLAWYFNHPEEVLKKENRIQREFKKLTWTDTSSNIFKYALSYQQNQ